MPEPFTVARAGFPLNAGVAPSAGGRPAFERLSSNSAGQVGRTGYRTAQLVGKHAGLAPASAERRPMTAPATNTTAKRRRALPGVRSTGELRASLTLLPG